ncbi:glycoside hydrolase family 71 protein [Mycena amicta]|nr:glycoside hydrolase family 71 protein [Mycena amicta]
MRSSLFLRSLAPLCFLASTLATPVGDRLSVRAEDPPLVAAHYIVGNTKHYTPDVWETHIQRASKAKFDAFALNIGNDPWQVVQMRHAFQACRSKSFNLFIMLDMNVIPCQTADDAGFMDVINEFLEDPSYQYLKGEPLLSTFSGQACSFGKANADDGWKYALGKASRPVHFVPAFFGPQAGEFPEGFTVMDGGFNWNSAWPMGHNNVTFDSDAEWINKLDGRPYHASVSPWMFCHFNSPLNKNFIYYMDDWMFTTRWEQLIAHRQDVDMVQVLTWNDWGESHYLGPLLDAESQPGSEAWVNGYDHTPWLDLFAFYITAFKTGFYSISQDRIFLWARLSPAQATVDPQDDPVGPPANREWTQDFLWGFFLLLVPGQIRLECGSSRQTWPNMPAGISKVKLPLNSNCQVKAFIDRTGDKDWSLEFTPPGFVFDTKPSYYNFNAFVAASPL